MADDFTTRLRMLLAFRGWKQKDLAKEIRAEPNTVNGWINGRKAPIGPVKYAIAAALGVEYRWLNEGIGSPPWADQQEPVIVDGKAVQRAPGREVTLEELEQEEKHKRKKRDSA